MRNVRVLAVALSLSWLTACAFNPRVDLQGGVAIAEGQCPIDDSIYKCFVIEKNNQLYVVAVDSRGPLAVYSVKELKADYEEGEATLVWSRASPKRRKDDT